MESSRQEFHFQSSLHCTELCTQRAQTIPSKPNCTLKQNCIRLKTIKTKREFHFDTVEVWGSSPHGPTIFPSVQTGRISRAICKRRTAYLASVRFLFRETDCVLFLMVWLGRLISVSEEVLSSCPRPFLERVTRDSL